MRWLGRLLAPAEDPRRWQPAAAPPPAASAGALLAELRRVRLELAGLRQQVASPQLAEELAETEQELLEAEHSLQLSLDERRVREVLLRAAELLGS